MSVFKLRNKGSIVGSVIIFVFLFLAGYQVLESVTIEHEINKIRESQMVVSIQIRDVNEQIIDYSTQLDEDHFESSKEKEHAQNRLEILEKQKVEYLNIKRDLDKMSVQLTFNKDYTTVFFEGKRAYYQQLLLLEASDKLIEELGLTYQEMMLEYRQTIELINRGISGKHYLVHKYHLVISNFLSHFIWLVLIGILMFQVKLLSWRQENWISFMPMHFMKQFVSYYWQWLGHLMKYFVALIVFLYGYLIIKGLPLMTSYHVVFVDNRGTYATLNHFMMYLITLLGWGVFGLLLALIKDLLGSFLKESLISTIVSIFIGLGLLSYWGKNSFGLNIQLLSVDKINGVLGLHYTLINIILTILLLILINVCLTFLVFQRIRI